MLSSISVTGQIHGENLQHYNSSRDPRHGSSNEHCSWCDVSWPLAVGFVNLQLFVRVSRANWKLSAVKYLLIHLSAFTQNPPTYNYIHAREETCTRADTRTHFHKAVYTLKQAFAHSYHHAFKRTHARTHARTNTRTHAHTTLKHRDPPIISTATTAESSLGKYKSKLRDSRVVNMTVVWGYVRHCTGCEQL